MPPLYADANLPNGWLGWLSLAFGVVGIGCGGVVYTQLFKSHWRWVGAVRRRLGRRWLVGVVALLITSTGAGVLLSALDGIAPNAGCLGGAFAVAVSPFAIGFGLYLGRTVLCNQPRVVNDLARGIYGPMPDVPDIPEPPREPVVPPAERAFLQAIRANPDDDTPRLIYADWLDERSDPRGEYLRVEVEANRGDPDAERRAEEMSPTFDADWVRAVARTE